MNIAIAMYTPGVLENFGAELEFAVVGSISAILLVTVVISLIVAYTYQDNERDSSFNNNVHSSATTDDIQKTMMRD